MADETQFRALVCEGLLSVIEKQQSLNTVLPRLAERVAPADRGLLQELLFGCCRWYFYLEPLCLNYLDRPLDKRDKTTRALLVLGAYQILFTRIPDHAAIFETVEAATQLKQLKTKALINAVLRKVAASNPPINTGSSHEASFPEWMSAKLRHNWPDQADEIFEASNQHPPMTLRINKQRSTRENYSNKLSEQDLEHHLCATAPFGITLASPCEIDKLPNFQDGMASVQDEAAQLCSEFLELKPGLRVLDACAAPGGKTCAMLELEPELEMLALDQDATRMRRVEDNLQRLQLSAETRVAEAQELDSWWDNRTFSRILLDAPCSATGVIRRHPDIKLLRKQEDLKNLADLQLQLLKALWQTLEADGILLYATCSIFPQENSRVIERFLKQEASAQLEPLNISIGIDTGFGTQLFPHIGGHDGFFYAKLRKRNV